MATRMDECCQSLQAYVGERQQTYGFDFTIFIPLVLELVVAWLGKCGQDEDEVFNSIKTKSFWAQYATRRAVREAAKELNVKAQSRSNFKIAADDVLDWAAANETLVRSGLSESSDLTADFSGVWE